MRRLVGWLGVFVLSSVFVFAQSVSSSSVSASQLAAQSMINMTGGANISDVTMSANVISILGSDAENGTAVLRAKGLLESRVDLTLASSSRSEARNNTNGFPGGVWRGSDGTVYQIAAHNTWSDASWFYPALSSLSGGNANIVFSYVGQEVHDGVAVQHITSQKIASSTLYQQLSVMDFYLAADTLLPVAVAFSVHPDNNMLASIPVEAVFSSYQTVGGITFPGHIQQYFQGTIRLDLIVTSMSVNSGVPDSIFTLP